MRLPVLIPTLLLLPLSLGFSFTLNSTAVSQCGVTSLHWSGGTPPFYLTVIPAFDYPQNISIPTSAWDAGSSTGEYQWTVNYPGGTRFAAMMSDATGPGTGGVSTLYTVTGSSAACTMRSTATDFLFYLNATTVTQCSNFEIYWDNTATDPVTILGVIPGGQPFQITSSSGSDSLVWNTNIASGTQFILAAFDSGKNGQGGSSDLMTVGKSANSACLDDSSPSSTPVNVPSQTATATKTGGGAVKTVTAIATVAPSGAGLKTGAIVGIVVGVVVTVLILQAALVWFCCRRQLASLISHRKQIRAQGLKPGGEVDLFSQGRSSVILEDDPSAADLMSASNRGPRSRASRASMGFGRTGTGTARSRSSVGDAYAYDETSISPFWDGARVPPESHLTSTSDGGTLLPPLSSLGSPFGSDTDLLPPSRPHIRTDSLSSTSSRPVSMHELAYLSPTSPSSASALTSTSRSRPPQVTKAQMAAALAAANPDEPSPTPGYGPSRDHRGEELQGYGSRQPPMDAPTGGFRLHEDAGRVDDVEDLPPMYRPEWETGSERERAEREGEIATAIEPGREPGRGEAEAEGQREALDH
ncbi:hypothetical protein JCM24511_05158 [Saitozyma sp. JCM 24511]|nr:hypothetical protein JCM24511_05158 [Saitozyma sp. JCM 24511]